MNKNQIVVLWLGAIIFLGWAFENIGEYKFFHGAFVHAVIVAIIIYTLRDKKKNNNKNLHQ